MLSHKEKYGMSKLQFLNFLRYQCSKYGKLIVAFLRKMSVSLLIANDCLMVTAFYLRQDKLTCID